MQLHLGEFNGTNATAMVRWCLSPAEIRRIKQTPSTKPMIIISIVKVDSDGEFLYEENRLIRPLTDMAVYISFRNPGKHVVLAGVLDDYDKSNECDRLLSIDTRHSGYYSYNRQLIDEHLTGEDGRRTPRLDMRKLFDGDIQAELGVEVDEKLFAKKPWDYKLVNYWFDTKPIDECHNRKRRFLAYFLTLCVGPLLYSFRFLFDVLLRTVLLGDRHINWRWFSNPFDNCFATDPFDHRHYNSWFEYRRKKDNTKLDKPIWRVLINWRSLTLIGLFVYFIVPLLLTHLVVTAILAVVIVGFFLLLAYGSNIGDWWSVRMRNLEQEALVERELNLEKELMTLDCQLVPEKVGLDSLPKGKRTVRLRFYKLKSRVCRPFAGS
jgi:hypothetical protein